MPIYELDGDRPEIADGCFIAPDAVLIGKVRVLKGASIWFGAVLRGDNEVITVGEDSNVQDNSVLHADLGNPLVIGRGVTVGHRVILHSAIIADHSLIGMGATILNRAHIGQWCLVGAGALVTEDKTFEDGKLIMGSPARAVRDVTDEQKDSIRHAAAHYVANSERYRRNIK